MRNATLVHDRLFRMAGSRALAPPPVGQPPPHRPGRTRRPPRPARSACCTRGSNSTPAWARSTRSQRHDLHRLRQRRPARHDRRQLRSASCATAPRATPTTRCFPVNGPPTPRWNALRAEFAGLAAARAWPRPSSTCSTSLTRHDRHRRGPPLVRGGRTPGRALAPTCTTWPCTPHTSAAATPAVPSHAMEATGAVRWAWGASTCTCLATTPARRRLYASLGYRVTSVMMAKDLADTGDSATAYDPSSP